MSEGRLYDFDTLIDRSNTDSLKFDFAAERNMPDGLIPMWVADMDYRVPEAVTDALIKSARHGVFGYTEAKRGYFDAVAGWWARRFGYALQEEWLVKTCGVVFALAAAVRAYTQEGDGVLIQNPVYYPFASVVKSNNRRLVVNPLVVENGRYVIDYDGFERKIVEGKVKLFVLCSPHNPVGRVWERAELIKLGEICLRHKVIVVADEIHCDFVFGAAKHTIFASLSKELEAVTVTCTAPSKTFNLAGLQVSNIFIADEGLRKRFCAAVNRTGYSQLNTMGLVACRAAYTHGEPWLEAVKSYIAANLEYVRNELAGKLPQVKVFDTEGTYLMWLDFNALEYSADEVNDRIINIAGLWLDKGEMFGAKEGRGFQRVNAATNRSVIVRAVDGLIKAFGTK